MRSKEEREASKKKFKFGPTTDKSWFKRGPSEEDYAQVAEMMRKKKATAAEEQGEARKESEKDGDVKKA